ncbi:zinc finger protein 36 C3H1 type-like 2-like, partial [Trifolium medium]|nr:zinc finger protein 36 C3H1 type-like 2-like [Trifolium medium]
VSKLRTLNENVPPMQIELDDTRGRYLQSTTMSPGFQPYAENIDFGSPPPLARYFKLFYLLTFFYDPTASLLG